MSFGKIEIMSAVFVYPISIGHSWYIDILYC